MIEYSADGKTAVYCGYKFRKDAHTGYYLCTKNTDIGRRERLHCFVWRKENNLSEIPNGYQIHHADENKDNNEIDNLVIMSESDHKRLHSKKPEKLEQQRKNMKRAAKYACAWHKSDEGRNWHSRHAKEIYKTRPYITYICDNCGKSFETRHAYNKDMHRFCCNNCKAAYRRRRLRGDIDAG